MTVNELIKALEFHRSNGRGDWDVEGRCEHCAVSITEVRFVTWDDSISGKTEQLIELSGG